MSFRKVRLRRAEQAVEVRHAAPAEQEPLRLQVRHHKLASKHPQFSYTLYAERIRLLAEERRLESQGDLSFMRFSEVRLPHEN